MICILKLSPSIRYNLYHVSYPNKLFEIINRSGYDVIGGVANEPGVNEWLSFAKFKLEYSNDGVCFQEQPGSIKFL